MGVTAYELLTRRYPFEATNPVALGLKVVANAPPPVRGLRPDVPEWVERAITRMLAKSPGDRFATSVAFVHELAGGLRRGATARPANSVSLVVDQSGQGDHRTIGEAIRASGVPGTRITVQPGIYREALVIDRDVEIVGEGDRSKVIVEGAPGANVFTFTSGSATLTGLTIRIVGTGPASSGWGAISVLILGTGPADKVWDAISVRGGTPGIEDCDLTSSAGSAVYILGARANPDIRNCTMRNSSGSGVHVYDEGQGTIEKCVISGNAYAGVEIRSSGNPTVRDCEVRGWVGNHGAPGWSWNHIRV